jgi:competence protein ComEC
MLLSLLTTCFLGALSFVALGWLPRAEAWLVALAMLASVASVATLPGRPLVWFLTMALSAGCWGALLSPLPARVDLAGLHGGLARLQLAVGRGGCSERGCWSEAELLACRELEPHACLAPGSLLGVASDRELPLGATVTALGKLSPRVTFHNPSEATLWPDTRPDVHASLQAGSQPRVDRVSWLDDAVSRARKTIRRLLQDSLRAPHAGIARALLLGEGAAVDRELNDAIRNAGVSHVLAVSGMHVTLLVGALVVLVRWLWLCTPLALYWEARRASAALGVVLAPLIARLCGASPSAVRAAFTSTLMYLVTAAGLRPSALAVSAFVVMAHAVIAPRDALQPGFVLSVLATAALLTHRRPARLGTSMDAAPTVGPVGAAFRESLRAWLATTPFLVLCFGQTSLVSLLANVALVPIGTALVPLAAVHAASAQLGFAAVLPSAPLFELVSAAFVEAARFCASMDPGLSLPPLTGWQLVALIVAAGTLMLDVSSRARCGVLAVTLLVYGLSEWSLRRSLAASDLRVTFLDVSQGDAALLETAGHAALIDAGGSIGGGPDPGALAVLPLLRARRITHLDWVVLSHPHPDHYGGLAAVLAAVSVGELWDTGQAEAEAVDGASPVLQLLATARAHGTLVRAPRELCGREHTLGSARVRVLAPCPAFDLGRGPNDNSFVLRVAHGAQGFLFTGDIEHEAEAELTRVPAALRSDVFKVPHHGSRTSSSEALLRAVSPSIAIVSAGRANRFGHPHPEVATRLSQHATQVLRTDQVGGIQIVSNGTHLTVTTAHPPQPE